MTQENPTEPERSKGVSRPAHRRASRRLLEPLVERMGPPLSRVAWSPDFTAQTLEILPLYQTRGHITWLKPVHADSLRVGLPRTAKPGDVVVNVMGWYPLTPRVVHSTSWRAEEGGVVLTYAVVVDPPAKLPPGSLVEIGIGRAPLARGGSLAAPEGISVLAVIEHALRHLAWLMRDDPAIAAALEGWRTVLDPYQPEPFRALA